MAWWKWWKKEEQPNTRLPSLYDYVREHSEPLSDEEVLALLRNTTELTRALLSRGLDLCEEKSMQHLAGLFAEYANDGFTVLTLRKSAAPPNLNERCAGILKRLHKRRTAFDRLRELIAKVDDEAHQKTQEGP